MQLCCSAAFDRGCRATTVSSSLLLGRLVLRCRGRAEIHSEYDGCKSTGGCSPERIVTSELGDSRCAALSVTRDVDMFRASLEVVCSSGSALETVQIVICCGILWYVLIRWDMW